MLVTSDIQHSQNGILPHSLESLINKQIKEENITFAPKLRSLSTPMQQSDAELLIPDDAQVCSLEDYHNMNEFQQIVEL